MPTFPAPELERAAAAVLTACGVPERAAQMVASHLVEAELSGVISHGIIRVPQYVGAVESRQVKVDAELRVFSERPACCVLDGGGGFGQVMAHDAMERAIDKASQTGIGAATLVNTSHTGRLASYALQAANRGMAGIVLVNAGGHGQWVAPYGGRSGRLSTNPIAFAIPRQVGDGGKSDGDESFPIVLDMATSIVPEGKVRATHAAGKELPDGWIMDSDGKPSTHAEELYGSLESPKAKAEERGAIFPAAGHKGYGLGFVVDLLAGALSGAGTCRHTDAPLGSGTDGVLIVAIDVKPFVPYDRFVEMADGLVAHVKTCPPAPGFEEVFAPGEIEARHRREALQHGITIDAKRWATIAATFDRLGVRVKST